MLEIISGRRFDSEADLMTEKHLQIKTEAFTAQNLYRSRWQPESQMQETLEELNTLDCATESGQKNAMQAIRVLFDALMPFTSAEQMQEIWDMTEQSACARILLAADNASESALITRLMRSISQRNYRQMIETGERLLNLAETYGISQPEYRQIAFMTVLAGHYGIGNYATVAGYRKLEGLSATVGHAEKMLRAAAGRHLGEKSS